MAEDHSPPRARRWRKGYEEVVVAAVLLLGAIFFRVNIDAFVRGRSGPNLDPDFWPGALLTLGIVLSAVYLVMAVVWARREGDADVAAPVEAPARTGAGAGDVAGETGPTGLSGGSTPLGEIPPGPGPEAHPEAHTGSALKMVVGFALLAAYIYLLDPIGFIPASVLFSIGFMWLVGERRWYVLLVFPLVAVTVLLGIFTQLLVVALPRGSGIFVDLSTYFY